MAESLFNKVYNPDVLHDFVNASDCFTGVEIKRSIQKGAYRWKNSFSGYGYGYRALAIYNIVEK